MPERDETVDNELDAQQDDTNLSASEETEEIAHSNGTATRVARLEANQQALQLLSDPDIAAVVRARQAGKQVKVEEVNETPEPEPEVDITEGLAEDDPARQTLGKISKLINSKLSSKDSEIEQLKSRVEQLQGVADAITARDVNDQLKATMSKYKDFTQYRDSMVQLSKQHPGLKVEDLYVLAKSRAGKLKMVEQATATERPSSQPQRSASRRNTPAPKPPPGRKGFDQILAEKLSNLDLGGD